MLKITKRKLIWYLISLLIIIPGIVSFFAQGLNLGIDFTGGDILQVQFEQATTENDIRQVMSEYVTQTPSIQAEKDNGFLIKSTQLEPTVKDKLLVDLESQIGKFTVLRSGHIGPVIGQELTRNAILSLVIALLLMLVYISIRFKFNFAVAAIVPLIHDVLVVLSVFSLLQIEIDSAFIAAILTIVGYSINNTIVIFDRIRENVRYNAKEDWDIVVDKSITQTLARSINTVLAVLILLVSLYFFGGETTKNFIFALILGSVAGTYSSVFLAGSFLVQLNNWTGKKKVVPAVKSK